MHEIITDHMRRYGRYVIISGKIQTKQESIIEYHGNHSFEVHRAVSFNPLFMDELEQKFTPTEWNNMKTFCQGISQCLFDYGVTGVYKSLNTVHSLASRYSPWVFEGILLLLEMGHI